LANSNQLYFNNLAKTPCHKKPYRCPHHLSLSSQSSRSCAGLKIKVLKDKGLEFANSIRPLSAHETRGAVLPVSRAQKRSPPINIALVVCQEVLGQHADRLVSPPPVVGIDHHDSSLLGMEVIWFNRENGEAKSVAYTQKT
jgi:hypothetical protein